MTIFVHCGVVNMQQFGSKRASFLEKRLAPGGCTLAESRQLLSFPGEVKSCGAQLRFRKGGELTRLTGSKPIRKGDRMKKSLIAAAVAGLFAAPAAMADVTISGAINVGIVHINSSQDSLGLGKSGSRQSLANNYSNINISSTDDIGNGNKVIFNAQFEPHVASLGALTNRNSYLGMEGSWGSFKMGTNENVYERWMYESDPLDGAVGLGGSIQMLGHSGFPDPQGASLNTWFLVGNTTGDGFWRRTEQTIWYNSPDIGGFTFEIDQTLSAFKSSVPGDDTNPMITSLGGQFKPAGGPFFVNLGYERHRDVAGSLALLGGTDNKADALQVGGGFTLGDLNLYARYERLQWKASGGLVDKLQRSHYWFAGKLGLPSGYLGAEFGIAAKAKIDGNDVASSGAKMFSVGYFHNLSKQSQLQFIGTRISNDDNAAYTISAGTGAMNPFPGSDQTAFTVGMKHTF
jgi:predicted porin